MDRDVRTYKPVWSTPMWLVVFLATYHLLLTAEVWAKAGLQTKFGVVTIENLQPGVTYNTRELVNLPLVVRNTGDERITVRIDILYPDADSPALKIYNCEVIPSTSWIQLTREEFEIDAGASEGTDVLVTIPDDDKYLGKRYQVNFHIRTITKKFIAPALMSNLRFSVARRRLTAEELAQREKVKLLGKIDFDLVPTKAFIKDLPLGREVDLDKEMKQPLKLSNPNNDEFIYYLDVVGLQEVDMRAPPGYEELPQEMVLLKEKEVRVLGDTIKRVKLSLKIPDEEKYRGKNFIFAIRAQVAGTPVELNQVARILITTAKGR